MCKFSVIDVIAMQECLESYKRLIEWIPPIDNEDDDMRLARLNIVSHLSELCDDVLKMEKDLHGYA